MVSSARRAKSKVRARQNVARGLMANLHARRAEENARRALQNQAAPQEPHDAERVANRVVQPPNAIPERELNPLHHGQMVQARIVRSDGIDSRWDPKLIRFYECWWNTTDIDGRPGRGPAKTKRAREAQYLRGNLIKAAGPGTFIQDHAATSGLKAEYKSPAGESFWPPQWGLNFHAHHNKCARCPISCAHTLAETFMEIVPEPGLPGYGVRAKIDIEGSPQGVIFGREAQRFLIEENANPRNKHYWSNDEACGEETCVFDGTVEVNKFNRDERIDHYLPFVNHANRGENNVGHVWIKLRGKIDRRTPHVALLYVTNQVVKAGTFLRVVYRSNDRGCMRRADKEDASGMPFAN